MSFALGSKQLWWLDNDLSANVWHSVDFASVEGFNDAQLNKVETFKPIMPRDGLVRVSDKMMPCSEVSVLDAFSFVRKTLTL